MIFMIDKKQVQIHFSKKVDTYDSYANVQKLMCRNLMNYVKEEICDYNLNILEIGCGTGYLTEILCRKFHNAKITAIDIAPGMIEYANNKLNKYNINFICNDIEELELSENYDLIISNATFQWLNNTELTLKKLYNSLNYGGSIIFSTFGNKTFQELNDCYKKASEILNLNNSFSSIQKFYTIKGLYKLCSNIIDSDQSVVSLNEELKYEYFDNCMGFLYSIKNTGANGSVKQNRPKPKLIKKVIDIYDKDYRINNKIRATYHCLFCSIEKNNEMFI